MSERNKKGFFLRLKNFRIVFRYVRECADIIKQGKSFKDKAILSLYYCRIPLTVWNSLISGKHFRELEEQNKFLAGPVTIMNKDGIFYCGNNILTVYIVNQYYEHKIAALIKQNIACFVDIGAHIGKYTIKLGRQPADFVIALEPDRKNFALLKKNIEINNLSNILCINKAAFFQKTKRPLYISSIGDGSHSLFKQPDQVESEIVETDTLDNIFAELKYTGKVDLIKIDAEGSEVEVIYGATETISKNKPDLIIEIWKNNPQNLIKIEEILSKLDYQVRKIDDDNYYFSVT